MRPLALALLLWGPPLAAAPSLSLDLDLDEAGGWRQALQAGLPAPGQGRLDLYLDRQRSEGSEGHLDTRTWRLGLSSDPLADLVAGVEYEEWGQAGALGSETLRGVLGLYRGAWYLGLEPQARFLRLYLADWAAARVNRAYWRLEGRDLTLRLGYTGGGPFSLAAAWSRSTYSEDLHLLVDRLLVSLALTPETLDLAAGLDAWRSRLEGRYRRGPWSLGLALERARSAVDDALADAMTLHLGRRLGRRWTLRLRLGLQDLGYTGSRAWFAGGGVDWRLAP